MGFIKERKVTIVFVVGILALIVFLYLLRTGIWHFQCDLVVSWKYVPSEAIAAINSQIDELNTEKRSSPKNLACELFQYCDSYKGREGHRREIKYNHLSNNQIQIRVSDFGYLDDSVEGELVDLIFYKKGTGWTLKSKRSTTRCWRGPSCYGDWVLTLPPKT